jgi:hypothetical protein
MSGFLIGPGLRSELRDIVAERRNSVASMSAPKFDARFEDIPRRAAASGGLPIRLAQTSGPWPNEPPLNVKAVQLFKQPDNPAGPADWVPETDEFGDPVFAVAINWFSHIPVGQGDLIKWCAIVPISDLPGEYDTGQVISSLDGPDVPIMRPYGKLWLLIALEC